MADETVVTEVMAETEAPNAAPTGAEPGKQTETRTFSQAEVDALIAERLQRAAKKADESSKKAAADAEAKALKEQGEFKTLFEKAQAELETERQRAKALELSALKRQAAEKVGLPAALADRLMGDDAEALEADARAVLAALPKPAAPNINAASGGGNGAQLIGGMTEDMLREQATRLGVNPEYYRKQFIRS